MRLRFFFICLLLAANAQAEDFKIFKTYEMREEIGRVDWVVVDTAKQRIKLSPPRDFIMRADEAAKSIKLESRNGQTAIAILFTTNSPSALPDEGTLKTNITKIYPDAVITGTGPCRTHPEAGIYFDLKKKTPDNQSLTIRHAFVPNSEGLIELIYRTNGEPTKEEMYPYNFLIMSFQAGPKPPPK